MRRAFPLLLLAMPRIAGAVCGDGVRAQDESCDDQNRASGDGCDASCRVEVGWDCQDASLAEAFTEVLFEGGFHRPPNWSSDSTDRRVVQGENTKPTLYVTTLPTNGVSITLEVAVYGNDDDFIGLAIGYDRREWEADDADWILLDWKKADIRSPSRDMHAIGCRGEAGLAISHVQGPIKHIDDLWCHMGSVHELSRAQNLGYSGWKTGRSYVLRLEYNRDLINVYIDDQLQISQEGFFPLGTLGLYSFSQRDIVYQLLSPDRHSICAARDTDNDGVSDPVEQRLRLDPENPDSDGDGVSDLVEVGNTLVPLDTDRDGVINALDPDDDGDTVPTRAENIDGDLDPANDDFDRDGVPNYLDSDDDNDSISTAAEGYEGRSPLAQDSDKDGFLDMVDLDDDGDGVPSVIEAAGPDGVLDSDRDGTPDYIDPDDDGDGLPTQDETQDGDLNPRNDDTDRDGIPDYLDIDDDGDRLHTNAEIGRVPPYIQDSDGDGQPDHQDADDDGDGVRTAAELFGRYTPHSATDMDADGVPDDLDSDRNGDGIADRLQRAEGPLDSDGDGRLDADDFDDDNDGVTDELDEDDDGDGIPDELDIDADGNGVVSRAELQAPGTAPLDSDGDGLPDYLDGETTRDRKPAKATTSDKPSALPSGDGTAATPLPTPPSGQASPANAPSSPLGCAAGPHPGGPASLLLLALLGTLRRATRR